MVQVEVHGLTKQFGRITAVEDINLEVDEGEVLGLLGPNGAGKTTTMRILAGIISPTSGYAMVYTSFMTTLRIFYSLFLTSRCTM